MPTCRLRRRSRQQHSLLSPQLVRCWRLLQQRRRQIWITAVTKDPAARTLKIMPIATMIAAMTGAGVTAAVGMMTVTAGTIGGAGSGIITTTTTMIGTTIVMIMVAAVTVTTTIGAAKPR